MSRTARASRGGICYHVISRGNARSTVFHDDADYRALLGLLRRASARLPIRVLGFCLMPNHIHLVLQPYGDGDLGRWMHWLLTCHVLRHRRRHGTVGRIWQGRFKAPPVQSDAHLLAVLRYVERNPVRAGLVERAELWRWSSLLLRLNGEDSLIAASPIPLSADWVKAVNDPLPESERAAIRESLRRERPFGDAAWTRGTAERLDLLHTLVTRGRPRG